MSTALVFFCVKCAFENIQNLAGVMSRSTRCQTERCKSSCANVCKRTQMIDQIWQKSLTNLSSSRKCYGSHIFKEGNVSFNTKDFLKQLAQSHTFQYVSMFYKGRNWNQSIKHIILFSSLLFFFLFRFSYVIGVFPQVTILMALNFLTESSLYTVFLRFTEKKNAGPLIRRIVFCTRQIC